MELNFKPGSTTVQVKLTIGGGPSGGVKLVDDVRLTQQLPTGSAVVDPSLVDDSNAEWTGIAKDDDGAVILALEWRATEPNVPVTHYRSTIAVRDQSGDLLPAQGGSQNPEVRNDNPIGDIVPTQGSGAAAINIL